MSKEVMGRRRFVKDSLKVSAGVMSLVGGFAGMINAGVRDSEITQSIKTQYPELRVKCESINRAGSSDCRLTLPANTVMSEERKRKFEDEFSKYKREMAKCELQALVSVLMIGGGLFSGMFGEDKKEK